MTWRVVVIDNRAKLELKLRGCCKSPIIEKDEET